MNGWKYMMSTDGPKDKPYLVRKNAELADIEDWNVVRKTWQTNMDRNDAFLGLDHYYKDITEEEANQIIKTVSA